MQDCCYTLADGKAAFTSWISDLQLLGKPLMAVPRLSPLKLFDNESGREIVPNTGANAPKFFTLVTKS